MRRQPARLPLRPVPWSSSFRALARAGELQKPFAGVASLGTPLPSAELFAIIEGSTDLRFDLARARFEGGSWARGPVWGITWAVFRPLNNTYRGPDACGTKRFAIRTPPGVAVCLPRRFRLRVPTRPPAVLQTVLLKGAQGAHGLLVVTASHPTKSPRSRRTRLL